MQCDTFCACYFHAHYAFFAERVSHSGAERRGGEPSSIFPSYSPHYPCFGTQVEVRILETHLNRHMYRVVVLNRSL